MKYSVNVTINKPVNEVVALFDDASNYKYWMEGLEEYTTTQGKPLEVGAVSSLKFKTGKRNFDMTEKVLTKNLPEDYTVSYEANKVYNEVKNKFIAINENQTLYATENYFRFDGWVMKIFSWIMPGAFKKQSLKYLKAFKQFAESK